MSTLTVPRHREGHAWQTETLGHQLSMEHFTPCDAPITHITDYEWLLLDHGVEMVTTCVEMRWAHRESQSVPDLGLAICSNRRLMSTFRCVAGLLSVGH